MPPSITLTTDFGTVDGYVGAMKGVIARLAPDATVVDLAHDVPRHDVAHAAWVLATSAFEFPPGTIHVAVVDPGVGGARSAVIVAARGHLFVGPDNGTFAYVGAEAEAIHAITSPDFRLREVSATFHGRDVFAPTAAALARGVPASAAGPATQLAGRLEWPPEAADGKGVVVHVDVFGNLVSNVRSPATRLSIAGRELPVSRTFEDAEDRAFIAYVGSAGTLEVAVRGASAAHRLQVGRGTIVEAL